MWMHVHMYIYVRIYTLCAPALHTRQALVSVEQLPQCLPAARVVVSEQPAAQVGEALAHDGVLGVHTQGDAFDDGECTQDEHKVGGNLGGEAWINKGRWVWYESR